MRYKKSVKTGIVWLLICAQFAAVLPSKSLAATAPLKTVSTADISKLEIPPDLGTVRVRQIGKKTKTLFIIEDAHASAEAQSSIQKIIENLSLKQGVKSILLEGTFER